MPLVKQKPCTPDCQVACVASALDISYDEAMELLGYKGIPLPKGGIDARYALHRLLKAGWAAVLLDAAKSQEKSGFGPAKLDIKAQLPGRKAIVGYYDEQARDHAIYWDGQELYDLSTPPPPTQPKLDTLKIDHALVLFPVPLVSTQ